MPLYTLEKAQQHLDAWLAAELALATSKSYTIGTRQLTRTDLRDVMDQIKYWQAQVDIIKRATSGQPAASRVRRYLPLDL